MEDDLIKFSLPEVILGLLLTLSVDTLRVLSDLGLAIPAVGIVLFGLVEIWAAIVWAIILFWFVMKLGGFGGPGLLQLAGGILEMFGIPGQTLAFIAGTFLANHPKMAAVAGLAVAGVATAATGGVAAGGLAAEGAVVGGEAVGGAVAAEGAMGAAGGGIAAAEGAATAGGATAAEEAGVAGAEARAGLGPTEGSLGELQKSMENLPEPEPTKEDSSQRGRLLKFPSINSDSDENDSEVRVEDADNTIDLADAA